MTDISQKIVIMLLTVFMLSTPFTAKADEPLNFAPVHSAYLGKQIKTALKDTPHYTPLVAYADLNLDGEDEYIIKNSSCNAHQSCHFRIFGDTGKRLISIGETDAYNIFISDRKTAGTRDIMIYTDPENDFKPERLYWDPLQSQYKAEK